MMVNRAGGRNTSLPANWAEMTPELKRKWRLENFASGEKINFLNVEAKNNYKMRARRMIDVYSVQEPDRVPLSLPAGNLPLTLFNVNARTSMYDCEQALAAARQFNEQYSSELEYYYTPFSTPGKVLDLLDYKLYAWPGRGLPLGAGLFQFIEGEYMKADEYDDFILDPSDFWLRTYLPRVFGTLAPMRDFSPLPEIVENVSIGQFSVLANPQVRESLLKLVAVGDEYQNNMKIMGPYMGLGQSNGYPVLGGAMAKAPFDTLGDTLRGTAAIMKDMYRRPDKVLEACDKLADLTIKSILKNPGAAGITTVNYPLHKGADGWMSQKQFETFYWPSLKKVMNAFINEGMIQILFAEGAFNTRLESVNEFPKGAVSWMFDQSDMLKAKKILGGKCCISGNVPASLIVTGSAQDVKAYCRKLIEGCGHGGGYILAAGCIAENPKLDNLRAMVQAVNEYGYYRK
jgi:hypothetical protein